MAFTPQHNQLFAALSEATQARLFRLMDSVMLPQGKTLYEAGEIVSHVYFPVDSIISLLHVMGNGDSAEVSLIGNEGLAGIPLFMGAERAISRAVVRCAGQAYQVNGKLLLEEFNRHGELKTLILHYAHTLIIQISNTSLCYRYHSVPQQLCRFLLLSLDRLRGNRLGMTQKQIADNLGVRREGISEAAGTLRRLGVLQYHRGHITVLNRNMLEQLSCECYAKVKQETDRLMPKYKVALAEGDRLELATTE
ncbi:MAG: Crp/Fnr family transcriptional regulator [Pseudomonas sp. PGPPP3]|nr:MAG: Crp/Fnr family transcriptional regulator [Pseudomonas sp. PGPPP3]